MSEWQPARVKDVHNQWNLPLEVKRTFEAFTFRVRTVDCGEEKLSGCPHVAEIDQSQVSELWPRTDGSFHLCEHEILTD